MEIKDILKYIKLYTGCDDHAIKRVKALLDSAVLTREVIKVVEKTNEVYIQKKKTKQSIKKWAEQWMQKNNMTYEQVAHKSRKTEVLRVRNKFCIDAYKEGYGCAEIGRYLKRDHTTILHSINKIKTI